MTELDKKMVAERVAKIRWDGAEALELAQTLQDVIELLHDKIKDYEIALNQLARLGNGPHLGNSDGNMIARKVLEHWEVRNGEKSG